MQKVFPITLVMIVNKHEPCQKNHMGLIEHRYSHISSRECHPTRPRHAL